MQTNNNLSRVITGLKTRRMQFTFRMENSVLKADYMLYAEKVPSNKRIYRGWAKETHSILTKSWNQRRKCRMIGAA